MPGRYISAIAQGDKGALAQLYEETKTAVYGYVLSILRDTHDAEDVLQETYIQIYKAASGYQEKGKPLAWIFTIARNLSLMKLRSRQKESSLTDVALEYTPAHPETFSPEDKLLLDGALKMLAPEDSQIVMLHSLWGFKHREIAKLMDLPLSTVLSKYNRAIKKLDTIIKEEK